MVAQGHGQIVNTASGAGLAAPPFVTPYATTKFAVVGLSTGLRPEAALHGVQVSVLCPGSIDTAILDRAQDPDLPDTASAPVTGREYLGLLKQRPTPVDAFARKALGQMARNRGVIVVPRQAKALWYVQRLSPGLLERALVPIARRVQRDLVKARVKDEVTIGSVSDTLAPLQGTTARLGRVGGRKGGRKGPKTDDG
jgi:short-subunit dehydrogenase